MNKRVLLPLFLLLGLVLAACADAPQATPTAEVPSAPAEAGQTEAEPPEAAPVEVDGAPLTAAAALGVTWQWTVLRQAESPMPGVVPFPENYTITFMDDGVAAIRADCNNVIAEYTLGDDGSLKLVLGPSTMVACGDESQDAQYLNLLSKVVSGSIAADGLTLVTSDGEQLSFIPASGDTAGGFDMAAMQNVLWQWTTLTETDPAGQTMVPNPEAYTIAFLDDGLVAIQADCNMVRGGYGTTDGASGVVINLGPSTRAFCGDESRDQQFLALLAEVQGAELTADGLLLSTTTGATLGFANGGPFTADAGAPETEAPADTAGDEALNNILWQWTDVTETDPAALPLSPVPEQYTIGFQYGGTVAIQADCNRVIGAFSRDGEALSIQLGPSTMAFCGEESLDQQFLALLGDVSAMAVADGRLTLTTNSGATLGFRDGGLLPGAVGLKPSQISFASTGLALAYDTRVVPATPYDESSPPGPSGLPEHLQVTFGAPAAADDAQAPVMVIIPAAAYEALWAANENESISVTLGQIAELAYNPPNPGPTSGVPVLPWERVTGFNDVAAQFAGLMSAEESAAKDGYRFAGRFAQDPTPVVNNTMQFIAQAFTNDGEFLVAFFYPPLTTDLLPTALDEVPAEQGDAYLDDPAGQIALVTAELNEATAADWQPDLGELDALVAALRIDGMAANGLEGRTWLWTGRTPVGGAFQPVADPASYTVTYNEDGTLFFQADCNSGGGSYAALGGLSGSVTHTLGAMTLAACPDGSRMDEFTGALSAVRSFRVLPGGQELEMSLPAGGEVLTFALEGTLDVDLTPVEPPQPTTPTGTVITPDGVFVRTGPGTAYPSIGIAPQGTTATIIGRSQDSQWWVANAAASPTGLGWVSAAFVAVENVENVPVIATPPLPTPVPTPTPVPPPAASISFRADQTTINAGDCTTLRWDVENIQAVWVFPQGQNFSDFPVTGQGSQQVCPEQTTTYQMRVQLVDGSVELRSITITVNQPNSLVNTSWQLATLNVNQLVVGGPLTLTFLGDSSASVQGGCNTFNGPYSAFHSGISIGPLFGTKIACEEGLMAQEAAYLQALESATTFTNDGSTLVLFGAGGELARFTAIVATPFGG